MSKDGSGAMGEPPDDPMSELERDLDFIGPITYHAVRLRGRRVPHLTATPLPGGRVSLSLDDRMCVEIGVQEAQWLVPFIADCILVGMGYTGFPDTGVDPVVRPVAPRMVEVDGIL